MNENVYVPFLSKILNVIPHTPIEYTFRMQYQGEVKPGQFFEVSMPKYGEAPISVSGIGDGFIDLTIRQVGKVTNEIFEHYEGNSLYLRGPYGNGFDVADYEGNEIVIVAGGTGVSPVRGVISYLGAHPQRHKVLTLIAGFKSDDDILFRDDFEKWMTQMNVILTVDKGEPSQHRHVGLVTAFIPQLDMKCISTAKAIVVGPPAMMRFATAALIERGFQEENIWISHERKMCCGLGKCGHCRINDKYVCLDGPVFPYTVGKNLID